MAYSYLVWNSDSLTQANISDLEESTVYEIYVAGFTEAGTGPYSERLRAITGGGKFLGIYHVYYNSSVLYWSIGRKF